MPSCLGFRKKAEIDSSSQKLRHKSKHRPGAVSHQGDAEDRSANTDKSGWRAHKDPGLEQVLKRGPQTDVIRPQLQLVQFSEA